MLFLRLVAALLLVSAFSLTPSRAETPGELLRRQLEAGNASEAVAALKPMASANNAEAQMAFGFAKFVEATEHLSQSFYKFGFRTPSNPFLATPQVGVPSNRTPEPLDYQKLRQVYQRYLDEMAEARAALLAFTAQPASGDVKLVLDLYVVKLRLGVPGDAITLQELLTTNPALRAGRGMPNRPNPSGPNAPATNPAPKWEVAFDRADAFWLAGYSHILSASYEFVMAHDWHTTFDATGYLFFAGAKPPANYSAPDMTDPTQAMTAMASTVVDQIALLHLIQWPAGDKARMSAVRMHLKSAVAMSRETWLAVLAETDDDREWLPSPRQKSLANPGMPVTDEMITNWLRILDDVDALLDGKKLLAHWRFKQGIDVRKFFEEPQPFDLVLWVTGQGALPFLKDGPTIGTADLQRWNAPFRNNLLGYAFFFN